MTVTTAAAALSDAVSEEEPDPQVPEWATRRTYSAKYEAKVSAE